MNLSIATYNSTGLGFCQREYINHILDLHHIDILLLQETWLYNSEIQAKLRSIHKDFKSTGSSSMDPEILLHGRPYGGVAIMWRKDLPMKIYPIKVDCKRACGIKIEYSEGKTMLILCAYMPQDNRSKTKTDSEFEECINCMEQCIEYHNCTSVIVGGDLNVDLQRTTAHLGCVKQFVDRNSLTFAWAHNLSPTGITYSSKNMIETGSCIDHFLLSQNLDPWVNNMEILDILTDHGHRPVQIIVKIEGTKINAHPQARMANCMSNGYNIAWHKVTTKHIETYKDIIRELMTMKGIDHEHFDMSCSNMNCCDQNHLNAIDKLSASLIDICIESGAKVFPTCKKRNPLAPYWKENVKPFRDDSIFWGKIWKECGRPPTGYVYDIYKKVRKSYHMAIKNHKQKRNDLRNCRIAESMAANSHRDMWTELKKMKAKYTETPKKVDGEESNTEICKIFHKKYASLYNSVPSDNHILQELQHKINIDC